MMQRQRLRSVLATAALLVSLRLEAADERIHQLTDRERVERRFAPGDAEYRRARAIAEKRTGVTQGYLVDGGRDPELLMAWELMRSLSGAFERDDAEFASYVDRWRTRGAAKHLGGDDFITRLRAVAGAYLDAEAELSRLRLKWAKADLGEREALKARVSGINSCRLRADALSEGRRVFGHENFQRFLYEVVAPDVVNISSAGSSPEATLQLWQWFEEGCR